MPKLFKDYMILIFTNIMILPLILENWYINCKNRIVKRNIAKVKMQILNGIKVKYLYSSNKTG